MNKNFLFEIGCEEIPAPMQHATSAYMEEKTPELLKELSLSVSKIETYITPRRMAIILYDVHMPQTKSQEKKGPLVHFGEIAKEKFCQKWGVNPKLCYEVQTDKGPCWAVIVNVTFDPLEKILEQFCRTILQNMHWPTTMIWSDAQITWIRPIRSLVCLYGTHIIPWSWGNIHTQNLTFGHRLWGNRIGAKGNPIILNTPENYVEMLKEAMVCVDAKERQDIIRDAINTHTQKTGYEPLPNVIEDLIMENAALTQWPRVYATTFNPAFLELPPEVITTTLQVHQRCFALRDMEKKTMVSSFLMVADGADESVCDGYKRVIEARLSDALYFWEKDIKDGFSPKMLRNRSFFKGLGTFGDKIHRMEALMGLLDNTQPDTMSQIVRLSKADLESAMVNEFPSLQGIMGRYYAYKQGLPPVVAQAISCQYLFHKSDTTGWTREGALLAIVDNLDTIVGFFGLKHIPSGSKDPFALRRAAHAIIRATLFTGIRFSLHDMVAQALAEYHHQGWINEYQDCITIVQFLQERALFIMAEMYPLQAPYARLCKTPVIIEMVERCHEFATIFQHSAGKNFLSVFKRVANMAKKSSTKIGTLNKNLLAQPAEKALITLLEQEPDIYADSMQRIQSMEEWSIAITTFFDTVRVKEAEFEEARMNLLKKILQHFTTWADMTLLLE